jgi:hypothetical protein
MTWVKNKDMHPLTNVAGRRWRANGGAINGAWHTVNDFERLTFEEYETLEWHFPDVDNAPGTVDN